MPQVAQPLQICDDNNLHETVALAQCDAIVLRQSATDAQCDANVLRQSATDANPNPTPATAACNAIVLPTLAAVESHNTALCNAATCAAAAFTDSIALFEAGLPVSKLPTQELHTARFVYPEKLLSDYITGTGAFEGCPQSGSYKSASNFEQRLRDCRFGDGEDAFPKDVVYRSHCGPTCEYFIDEDVKTLRENLRQWFGEILVRHAPLSKPRFIGGVDIVISIRPSTTASFTFARAADGLSAYGRHAAREMWCIQEVFQNNDGPPESVEGIVLGTRRLSYHACQSGIKEPLCRATEGRQEMVSSALLCSRFNGAVVVTEHAVKRVYGFGRSDLLEVVGNIGVRTFSSSGEMDNPDKGDDGVQDPSDPDDDISGGIAAPDFELLKRKHNACSTVKAKASAPPECTSAKAKAKPSAPCKKKPLAGPKPTDVPKDWLTEGLEMILGAAADDIAALQKHLDQVDEELATKGDAEENDGAELEPAASSTDHIVARRRKKPCLRPQQVSSSSSSSGPPTQPPTLASGVPQELLDELGLRDISTCGFCFYVSLRP